MMQKKTVEGTLSRDEQDDLKVKKAWEVAIGPAKR
jgi:hypothetical protein